MSRVAIAKMLSSRTKNISASIIHLLFSSVFICFLVGGPFLIFTATALGQTKVESSNYEIHFPNFNSGAGVPTSSTYKVDSTLGPTAGGIFSSANYSVRSGFEYIHTIIPFSFTVSNISINFGELTPNTPVTRTSNLTVKAGGAGGYSVTAHESHPLQTSAGAEIIDTLCDSGPCSQASAKPWVLDTTVGFGFNIWGDDVPGDFGSADEYRQFADISAAETPEVIMAKTNVTWDYPNNAWPWESEATVTFKVNVNNLQPAGNYQNIVTFVAIPSF